MTESLESLTRRHGFELRRGKVDATRLWLIRDGRLFTSVTDENTVRALLAPVRSTVTASPVD